MTRGNSLQGPTALAWKLIGIAATVVSVITVSRILEPDGAISFFSGMAVVNIATVVACGGVQTPTLRLASTIDPKALGRLAVVAGRSVAMTSAIVALAIWLSADTLAGLLAVPNPHVIRTLGLSIFPNALVVLAGALIAGCGRATHSIAISQSIQPLLFALFLMPFAVYSAPTVDIVATLYSISFTLSLGIAVPVIRHTLATSARPTFGPAEFVPLQGSLAEHEHHEIARQLRSRELLRSGSRVVAASLLRSLVTNLDTAGVGRIAPSPIAAEAYVVLRRVAVLATAPLAVIDPLLAPKLAAAWRSGSIRTVQSIVRSTGTALTILFVTFAIAGSLMVPRLGPLLGAELLLLGPLTTLATLSAPLATFVTGPTALTLQMHGLENLVLRSVAIGSALYGIAMVSTFFLELGLTGFAASVIIGLFTAGILEAYFLWSVVGIRVGFSSPVRALRHLLTLM